MTQKDKKLLLTDLSARLPYGVKFNYGGYNGCDYKVESITSTIINDFPIEDCKPYLRPMSSMTEEERNIYAKLLFADLGGVYEDYYKALDYLNARYFDYRGLIERGLAIEVTEENNPYKD